MPMAARVVRARGPLAAFLLLCACVAAQGPAAVGPSPDAPEPTADATVGAEAEVRGYVLDGTTGEPIDGARVVGRGESAGLRSETISDAAGAYELKMPAGGLTRLVCHRRGYARTIHPIDSADAAGVRVDFLLQPGSVISGRVTEAVSRDGVTGIIVTATPVPSRSAGSLAPSQGATLHYRATTNADGHYVIEGVPIGGCRVRVGTHDTEFLSMATNTQEVSVVDGVYYQGVDFVLTRGATVEGVITGPHGAPAPDAVVRVSRDLAYRSTEAARAEDQVDEAPHEARTSSTGHYRVVGLAFDRDYQVSAVAEDAAPTTSEPFRVAPGESPKRVDLALDPGSRVSGVIYRADGTPWGGANVLLAPELSTILSGRPARVNRAVAGDDGAFTFQQVGEGAYVLRPADAPGNPFTLDARSVEVVVDGAEPVEGADIQALPAARRPGESPSADGSIVGTVTRPDGAPAAGARVEAWRNGDARDAVTGVSSSDGSFSITGLEGVLYDLVVDDPQGVGAVQSVGPGARVTVALAPPATLEGVVLDARGNAVAEASVSLVRQDRPSSDIRSLAWQNMVDSGYGSRATDSGGRFAFRNASPGVYVIRARDAELGSGESRPIPVTGGDRVSDLRITLYSGVAFAGEVVDPNGEPVPGAVVRLAPAPRTEIEELMSLMLPPSMQRIAGTATTGADGTFSVDQVSPGDYRVFADCPGFAQYYADGLAISPGSGIDSYRIVLGIGGDMEGTCLERGEVVPGHTVLVVGEAGAQMTTTDDGGRFRFTRLAEGSYLVYSVDPSQLAPTDWAAGVSIMPTVADVVNGQTVEITLGAQSGGAIRGVLRGQAPGVVAMVSLRSPKGPAPESLDMLDLKDVITSARYTVATGAVREDGAFELPQVPAGEYILDVFGAEVSGVHPNDLSARLAAGRRPLFRAQLRYDGADRELNISIPSEWPSDSTPAS